MHPTLGRVIFWRQMAPRAPRCVWKTDNTGRRQSVKDAFLCHEAMPLMRRRSSASGLLSLRTAVLTGESGVEGAAVWRQITAAVEELQRERRADETLN
jgi:hypothetical protein